MDIFDITLALTPRIGATMAKQLIDLFGSAQKVFSADEQSLRANTRLSDRVIADILSRRAMAEAEREMEFCARNKIEIIAINDDAYPTPLAQTYDPPHIIYCKGDSSILNRNLIAFVGTRKSSPYGERVCRGIIRELHERVDNLVIVSGLAHGIDAASHRAAIELDIPSVAIIPSSLPNISPRSHASLANSIVDAGGAIISEQRISSVDIGKNYIPRNRIIAGASLATIVVESATKGGSISTAQIASGIGRLVGAVPGRITDEQSKGCNRLIAQEVARPILSGADIVTHLGWLAKSADEAQNDEPSEAQQELWRGLTPPQQGMLSCFRFDDPLHISEIEELSQLPPAQVNSMLLELELYGVVQAISGARYERIIPLPHSADETD